MTLIRLLDELTAQLRERGERMTRPRQLILGVLAKQEGHLSADEVLAAVMRIDGSVHRATIYRTLDALCDLGAVQHVHVGHGATLYHLTVDTGPHIHLQCLGCGVVSDAPADVLRGAVQRLDEAHDFMVDPGHVALSGYCVACR